MVQLHECSSMILFAFVMVMEIRRVMVILLESVFLEIESVVSISGLMLFSLLQENDSNNHRKTRLFLRILYKASVVAMVVKVNDLNFFHQ